MIRLNIDDLKEFRHMQKLPYFTLRNDTKEKERQAPVNSVLRACYHFISEGEGLSSPTTTLQQSHTLRLLTHYLPEGRENSSWVSVGWDTESRSVRVWREGRRVVAVETWEKRRLMVPWSSWEVDIKLPHVTTGSGLVLSGCYGGQF